MNNKPQHRKPDLREQAEAYPDEPRSSWRPEPGDVLVGVVHEIDLRATKFDPTVPVLTFEEDETGELIDVWCLHAVLRNELARKSVQLGDRVAIRRLQDSSEGYKRYKVLVDREKGQRFSWGAIPVNAGDVDPAQQSALLQGLEASDEEPPIGNPPPDDDELQI